jgi:hypothetical protein
MEGIETRRDVEYNGVVLPQNNVEVNGIAVTKDGKLYGTVGYMNVKVNNNTNVRFRLNQKNSPDPQNNVILGEFTTTVAGVDGWVMGVDIASIIEEFTSFVEADIKAVKAE